MSYEGLKMKKVNMITTLSPQKQYEIRRWFWATFCVCVSMIFMGAYFFVPQLLLYVSLQKEVSALREKTKNYTNAVSTKDALKKEYETLRMREGKIHSYNNQRKNPYQHIATIVESSSDNVKLESVRFNKKECEIIIMCPTAEHAHVFVKRLAVAEYFAHVKLVSLQHEAQSQQLRCVIKGKVIF
jgi:hypothetical protein